MVVECDGSAREAPAFAADMGGNGSLRAPSLDRVDVDWSQLDKPVAIDGWLANEESTILGNTFNLLTRLEDPARPPRVFVDCTDNDAGTYNQSRLTELAGRELKITLLVDPMTNRDLTADSYIQAYLAANVPVSVSE